MAKFNCITFILLLLFSTQSSALNLSRIDQPLEDGIYDNRNCNDLYLQASALEQDTFINKTNIYNDKRASVASYAVAVFTPAFYYLGFNAFQNYRAQIHSEIAFSKISEIRYRMAEKRCFEQN
ncbi:MAG: hypothetical protein O7D86_10840 [Proteobacteria bacterium]|nr:hypothetical protein [Pseudomonadota bacterium]